MDPITIIAIINGARAAIEGAIHLANVARRLAGAGRELRVVELDANYLYCHLRS